MFCVCRMVLGAAPHFLGPSQQGNTGKGWVPWAHKPSTSTKPAAPYPDAHVSWTPGLRPHGLCRISGFNARLFSCLAFATMDVIRVPCWAGDYV